MNIQEMHETAESLIDQALAAQSFVWPLSPYGPWPTDDMDLDIRVATDDGSSFVLLTGDVGYDTRHYAGCGASSIGPNTEACDVMDALVECIDDALDQLAQGSITL